ncbi:hypothetical protein ACROYT_G043665 [Oculina patagonica]
MLSSSGVAIATVHSFLVLVNIVGNVLVCLIIYKNRDMRIPINYLLLNLAVADILYATFLTPDTFLKLTTLIHPDGMTGAVLCKLLTGGIVAWIAALSSVFTLVAIVIERYYAVMYPLGNKGKLTKRKLKLIAVGSWIFPLIITIPLFLVESVKANRCGLVWPEEWMSKANYWMWFVLVLLSVALMAGLYSRVVYTLWFKRNDDNQLTYQQRGVLRVRKRVTLMVITVTAMFGICWIPDVVAHVVNHHMHYSINQVVLHVIHTMILFNSAANPFVYALINQNFREKIKGMKCCSGSTAVIEPASRQPHCIELANVIPPTHEAGACSRE